MSEPPFDPPDPPSVGPSVEWGSAWGWNWTPDSTSSRPAGWVGLPPTSPPVPPAPTPRKKPATGTRVLPFLVAVGYVAVRLMGMTGVDQPTSYPPPTYPQITMDPPPLGALPDSIGGFNRSENAQARRYRQQAIDRARTDGREADAAMYVDRSGRIHFIFIVWSGSSADPAEGYISQIASGPPMLNVDRMQTSAGQGVDYACAPIADHGMGSVCAWASSTDMGYLEMLSTPGDPLVRIRTVHHAYVTGKAAPA